MAELVQNLQLLGEAVVVPSMHFVEDAVVELVRGRQVLIASYVYAYRIVIRRVLDKFEQLQVSVFLGRKNKVALLDDDDDLRPLGKTGREGGGVGGGRCSAAPSKTSV